MQIKSNTCFRPYTICWQWLILPPKQSCGFIHKIRHYHVLSCSWEYKWLHPPSGENNTYDWMGLTNGNGENYNRTGSYLNISGSTCIDVPGYYHPRTYVDRSYQYPKEGTTIDGPPWPAYSWMIICKWQKLLLSPSATHLYFLAKKIKKHHQRKYCYSWPRCNVFCQFFSSRCVPYSLWNSW